MKAKILALLVLLIFLVACSQATQSGNPAWVDALIRKFQSEPVGNPPQSIWRYDYQGQVVYYVPAQCCDMFSTLYTSSGDEICAPDGGIIGKGDGQCPDFLSQRTNGQLIWEDTRTR